MQNALPKAKRHGNVVQPRAVQIFPQQPAERRRNRRILAAGVSQMHPRFLRVARQQQVMFLSGMVNANDDF